MNKWTYSSLFLVVISVLVLIGAYYYYINYNSHDMRYAKAVVSVTSNIINTEKPVEPEITVDNDISEEKGILIVLLTQVLLLIGAISFVGISKSRHGKNRVHLPLIMAAFLVVLWVLYTTYKLGLFTHA
jgi:uncharacterized protein (UPF0333 family)